jgi:hypothetical protein
LAHGLKVFEGNAENPDSPHAFSVTAECEFEGRHVREVNRIDLRRYFGAKIPQDGYVRKLRHSDSLKIAAPVAKAPSTLDLAVTVRRGN